MISNKSKLIIKIKIKLVAIIIEYQKKYFKNRYRKKLKNKDFTIISSNCNGAVITSDLGIRFNSPTVNLFFYPDDYLKFVSNIKFYVEQELIEDKSSNLYYPVGILFDIKIHFMHYNSFKEAKEKWDIRKMRINYNNIFIMFTDRDGCTYEHIKEFDSLQYKNKVIFTNKHYNEFKSSYYIRGFENEDSVGILSEFIKNTGKRRIYEFDFVKWLNK